MTISRFVGVDPVGLAGLADTADQYAIRLVLAGRAVADTDHRYHGSSESISRVLATVAMELSERATELRWRAAAIEEAQQIAMPLLVTNSLQLSRVAEFAALAVFDLSQWEEAYASWRTPPSLSRLLKMDPAERADAFAGLAPSVAEDLARRSPRLIGGLDGAPAEVRYLANELLVEAKIVSLERLITRLENPYATDPGGLAFGIDADGIAMPALANSVVTGIAERAAEYRRWLEEDRQILLFDPHGDGRAVEVFGDLTTATRVGVVIPGMANSLSNFSDGDGGFRENAANLFNASLATEDVATIAWLGYDTPDNVGAAVRAAAEEGAPQLIRFLEGIDTTDEKIVTVVAHSYGSVLAGLAARTGIAADNLVFVGSPGTTLDNAGDAVLRSDGRVWSALAEDDPIAWGIAPSELPTWPLLPNPIVHLLDVFNAFRGAEDLWHGTNPGSDEFGASRLATDGSSGHSSYFESGSLDNLALIVEGRYSEVKLAD